MTRLRAASAVAAGVLVVVLGGGAAAGVADPAQDGLWYMSLTGVDQVHASGVTGEGITIAVLDGPINPDLPELVGTNLEVQEDSFCDEDGDGVTDSPVATDGRAVHASNMAALIVGTGAPTDGHPGVKGIAPGATVRHYAIESDWAASERMCEAGGRLGATAALEQALDDGVDIVSMSFAGTGWGPDADAVVARAVREGVILLGASGQEIGIFLGMPAEFNGAIGVESANSATERSPRAVVHPRLDVVAPGEGFLIHEFDEVSGTWTQYSTLSGSSSATAYTAGVLALAWSANPQATGNQMIQALVRTTTQNAGELRRIDDAWGYGLVNINNLMLVDPTQYPDENPLISPEPGHIPNISLIFPEDTPEPTPTDEATDTPGGTDPLDTVGMPPMALLLGGGALTVLVIVVVAVMLVRGRRPAAALPPGAPPQEGPPGPPPPDPYRA